MTDVICAIAASLAEIGRFAAPEGFDGERTIETIAEFNCKVRSAWEILSLAGACAGSAVFLYAARFWVTEKHSDTKT